MEYAQQEAYERAEMINALDNHLKQTTDAKVISLAEVLLKQQEARRAVQIEDTTSNPAPLGLLGFGMTTILLNIHNAGYTALDTMILGMGIFYGGLAQIIAGIMEWKKKNTFGTTAFTSYGLFWLTLVGLLVLPKFGIGDAPTAHAMGTYLFMWGLLTAFLFIGTFKMNRVLQLVFFTLTALFFMLATADFTGVAMIKTVAGYEGIVCGLLACYAALAQVLNEVFGKDIFPLGPVK